MEVYITDDAKKVMNQYKQSLKKQPYYISNQRIRVKLNKLIDALLSLTKQDVHQLCMNKDLGQTFDIYGKPLHKNLYRFNYKDESNFQWAFAYIIDKKQNKITITKMIPSRNVKENDEMIYNYRIRLYESIMRDVAKIVKKAIINQDK